jgi:hypothetical protein
MFSAERGRGFALSVTAAENGSGFAGLWETLENFVSETSVGQTVVRETGE